MYFQKNISTIVFHADLSIGRSVREIYIEFPITDGRLIIYEKFGKLKQRFFEKKKRANEYINK